MSPSANSRHMCVMVFFNSNMWWLIRHIQIFILLDHFMIFLGSNCCFLNLPSYQHGPSKSSSAAQECSTTPNICPSPSDRPGLLKCLLSSRAWSRCELIMSVKEFRSSHFSILIIFCWRHCRLSRSGKACWLPSFSLKASHQISCEKGVPYPCQNGPGHTHVLNNLNLHLAISAARHPPPKKNNLLVPVSQFTALACITSHTLSTFV